MRARTTSSAVDILCGQYYATDKEPMMKFRTKILQAGKTATGIEFSAT